MAGVAKVLLLVAYLQVVRCTERPIIGILAQEYNATSDVTYIAASYVKAVEAAGARVVPIFLRKPSTYYVQLMHKLNGLVLPGGDAPWDTVGGFFQTASKLYSIAKQMNKAGIEFPILGVCQGFEALALGSNGMKKGTLTKCQGMDGVMLPLEFKEGFRDSNLYRDASDKIIRTLSTRNVTPNYHEWCLRPKTQLKEDWKILSVNKDGEGKEFVSSMENGNFVGVQFHPEKCTYEWTQDNPSYEDSLLAARYFYDWLVTKSRKNNNHFFNAEEEIEYLMYNYCPEYTGKNGSHFEQQYIFY